MPNITIKTTDGQIEIDRDLFQKFSSVARKITNDTLTVDVETKYVELVKEYVEHHQKTESAAPSGQVQTTWTVETVYDDKWDGRFFTKIIKNETDPYLGELARAAKYFDLTAMFRKIVVAVAIGVVGRAGTTNSTALAAEFERVALAKKD